MEEAVSDRRKTFAAAHRSDDDSQADISASRCTSSGIAKAKDKTWQTTCYAFSPISNSKFVYSILLTVACCSSSSFSSSNLPNCSSPWESASVFVDYLRSHFFVSQPKALRNRARDYLSLFSQATCPEESHLCICSPPFTR